MKTEPQKRRRVVFARIASRALFRAARYAGLLALAPVVIGCSSGPAVFAGPPADAPTWRLNQGLWNTPYNGPIVEPPYV